MINRSEDSLDTDRPGTLLKMLLTLHEDTKAMQTSLFQHFLPPEKFPELYARKWLNLTEFGDFTQLPFFQLVEVLSNRQYEGHKQKYVYDVLNDVKVMKTWHLYRLREKIRTSNVFL